MSSAEHGGETGESSGKTDSARVSFRMPSPKAILTAAYIIAGFSFYMHLGPYDAAGYSSAAAAVSRYAAFGLGLLVLVSGGAAIQRPLMVAALIPLLSSTYLLPLFHDIGYWGHEDWDQYNTFSLILLKVIGEHGQLPLWNPYICGGTVLMAYPNSLVLDPLILTEFVFGVVAGTKINILLYCVVGWYGCYILASSLGLRPYSRYLLGMVLILSGLMAGSIIALGHIFHIPLVYVPFIIVYLRKSFLKLRFCVPCSIFMCIFLMGAHPFIAVQTSLLICMCVLMESSTRLLSSLKTGGASPRYILQPVLAILTVALLTGLLFGFRLLPELDYSLSHSRLNTDMWSRFSYTGYGVIAETARSIGFIAFGLMIYGLWASLRRGVLISLMVFAAVSILISMNQNDPLHIWKTLSGYPILESLRPVNKAMGLLTLVLSVFSAAGLSTVESTRPGLAKLLFASCAILLIASNTRTLEGVFTIKPYSVNPGLPAFTPVSFERIYTDIQGGGMNSETLPYVQAGVRTVACYARSAGPVYALHNGSPNYLGEAFLLNYRGNATITSFTPNRVEVAVNTKRADTLVVNQNFEKNWKAEDSLKVMNRKGLLSARVTPNVRKVVFYYLPDLFLYGASLTALGLVITFASILKYGLGIFSAASDDNHLP